MTRRKTVGRVFELRKLFAYFATYSAIAMASFSAEAFIPSSKAHTNTLSASFCWYPLQVSSGRSEPLVLASILRNEESLSNSDTSEQVDHRLSPENAKKQIDKDVGGYDPSEGIAGEREINVGDPQIKLIEKERSVTSILKELAAIQQQGPQKYCILGTRHCSFLHQQIIELL
jgi:hypothetical protein